MIGVAADSEAVMPREFDVTVGGLMAYHCSERVETLFVHRVSVAIAVVPGNETEAEETMRSGTVLGR